MDHALVMEQAKKLWSGRIYHYTLLPYPYTTKHSFSIHLVLFNILDFRTDLCMFGYMYWGTTEYWDNQPLYIVICEIVLWYIYLTRTCVVGWWVSAVATCWVSCASARCGGSWSWCSWRPGPPRPAAPPPPPWGWRPRWTESNPGPPALGTLQMVR